MAPLIRFSRNTLHNTVSLSIALQVLAALKARLLDFDDRVRAAAVEAACKAAKASSQVCLHES